MFLNIGVVAMCVLALADLVQMDQLASSAAASEPYEIVKAANTPEFLNLATDNQRKEYIELESNMNVPVGTLRKAQDTWALKIGEPVLVPQLMAKAEPLPESRIGKLLAEEVPKLSKCQITLEFGRSHLTTNNFVKDSTVYGISAYGQHVATEDAAKAAETARMDKAVETLSQAAQEADKIIRGIIANESLTRKEINAMVDEQMQQLPKKIINELTVALQ